MSRALPLSPRKEMARLLEAMPLEVMPLEAMPLEAMPLEARAPFGIHP